VAARVDQIAIGRDLVAVLAFAREPGQHHLEGLGEAAAVVVAGVALDLIDDPAELGHDRRGRGREQPADVPAAGGDPSPIDRRQELARGVERHVLTSATSEVQDGGGASKVQVKNFTPPGRPARRG
jgi:hypothetical protein